MLHLNYWTFFILRPIVMTLVFNVNILENRNRESESLQIIPLDKCYDIIMKALGTNFTRFP